MINIQDDLELHYGFIPSDLMFVRMIFKCPDIIKRINKEHKPKKNLITNEKRKMWVIEAVYYTEIVPFETSYTVHEDYIELCYNKYEDALKVFEKIVRSKQ